MSKFDEQKDFLFSGILKKPMGGWVRQLNGPGTEKELILDMDYKPQDGQDGFYWKQLCIAVPQDTPIGSYPEASGKVVLVIIEGLNEIFKKRKFSAKNEQAPKSETDSPEEG